MRWLIVIVAIIALLFGVALPRYLAPDDLAHCTAPSSLTGSCQTADAVVAISGGDTMARAREAVKLYKAGWAKTLIFSGAASDKTGPSNAAAMKSDAQSLGVDASAILVDEDANTTAQNATNVTKLARTHNFGRLILVTSGYHERRATLEFKKAASGITIVSHPVQSDNQWSNWWWATPAGWWLSSSELIKIGAFYMGIS